MIRFATLVISVCALGLQVFSQQPEGGVQGKVFDHQSGESLPGTNVMYGKSQGIATDDEGKYLLHLSPGRYIISWRYIGYNSVSQVVDISGEEMLNIDVALEPVIMQIDQVVVSAGRVAQRAGESTVSLSVIQPQDYQLLHVSNNQELISKTPGIEILDGQASVRGGSGFSYGAGSRVLTLIDGLPALSADAGSIRWQFLPLENISQIEIIKGAASVLYGSSALNGVINYRLAEATPNGKTTFFAESGFFDRPPNRNWLWWNTPRLFHNISLSHLKRYRNTEVGIGSFFTSDQGYRRLNDETLARINLRLVQHSQRLPGLSYGVSAIYGYSEKTDFVLWENADTGALRQNETTASLLHVNYLTFDPHISFKASDRQSHDLRSRIQITDNNFPDRESINSRAISFLSEYQSSYYVASDVRLNVGALQNTSRVRSQLYGDHHAFNLAGYVQADVQPFERLTFVGGTRIEHNTLNDDTDALVPLFRTGVNYRIHNFTFLRGSWGQGYRFPSIAEKFAATSLGSVRIFPNPFLEAESGWNAETGIKQGILSSSLNGIVDLAFFYMQNKDLIEYGFGLFPDPDTGVYDFGFRAENTEHSRVYGLETEFRFEWNAHRVNHLFQWGYTYIYPVEFNPATGSNTSIYLKYRRKHSGSIIYSATAGNFDWGISLFVKSRMLDVDDVFLNELTRESILPGFWDYWNTKNTAYWVGDCNLGWHINTRYRISVAVKNFTNTQYMGRPGDIQPHRHFSLRFSAQF